MPFRHRLLSAWSSKCVARSVPLSARENAHSRIEELAEPAKVLDWHIAGLPEDDLSMENALLATQNHRWPLLVDPQGQMNVSFY